MTSDHLWLAENVAELRSAGKCAEAFEALATEHMNSEWVHLAFRHHFLGHRDGETDTPCMLIEFARKSREQNPSVIRDIIQKHFPAQKNAKSRGSLWELWPTDELRILLEARLKLINAFLDFENNAEDRITGLIDEAIQLYERAWPGCAPTSVADKSLSEPAFLRSPGLKRWEKVFREVEERARKRRAGGSSPSWDHPGLLMAGETVLYLQGDSPELPRKGNAVETWVLLAYPIPATSASGDDVSIPEGLLARLVVKTVAGGSGYLFPDPRYGYLPTDTSFEQGLRNVMQVIRHRNAGLQVDFRWRLTPLAPRDRSELPVPLKSIRGRSAEAAFACAIRGSIEGARLDRHIAITACFQGPAATHEKLAKIEGLSDKIVGLRPPAVDELFPAKFEATARMHLIDQILIAKGQNGVENDATIQLADRNMRLTPVTTFDEVYRKLSHDCQITDRVKKALAQRAVAFLKAKCTPYVRSSLSRRKNGIDKDGRPCQEISPLNDQEVLDVLRGQISPHNRVYLLAESGIGKSTLLVEAELLIAKMPGDILPVRIGAGPRSADPDDEERLPLLSSIHWNRKRDTVLAELAENLFGDLVPAKTDAERRDRVRWLKRLVDNSQVVFLLDALDQTLGAMEKLPAFLVRDGVRECPILLSGRPETPKTKPLAIAERCWDFIWVDPFDEARIRRYCGDDCDPTLLLDNEDWRPLIEVPILLQKMKSLAIVGELKGLINREEVYYRTLRMLVQRGGETLPTAGLADNTDEDPDVLADVLGDVAWETIQLEGNSGATTEENFTGVLEPGSYKGFASKHEKLLKKLWQLNFTVRQTFLDKDRIKRATLAWRHFSFCEWFAGLHLASMPPEERRKAIRQHCRDPRWRWIIRFALSVAQRRPILDVVHELASDLIAYGGQFLLWEAIKSDGINLSPELDDLVRWLVHRDMDGRGALKMPRGRPGVDRETADLLRQLFCPEDREYRDSRCLHPAWELLDKVGCVSPDVEIQENCKQVRDRFLGEFAEQVAAEVQRYRGKPRAQWQHSAVLQLVAEEQLARLGLLSQDELKSLRTWDAGLPARLHSFRPGFCLCPPPGWQHLNEPQRDPLKFWQGRDVSIGRARGYDSEGPRHQSRISQPFWLGWGPVTHAQFEVFDPDHKRYRRQDWQRGKTDHLDDHPVMEVSWFQAAMLAIWLTGSGRMGGYTLPEEREWEYACRAGRDGEEENFGIPWCDYSGVPRYCSLSSYEANFDGRYPYGGDGGCPASGPNLDGTVQVGGYPPNGFGLVDMHGQIQEWCFDSIQAYDHDVSWLQGDSKATERLYSAMSIRRMLRGGSFGMFASDCRSAYRGHRDPDIRADSFGFRLCWRSVL